MVGVASLAVTVALQVSLAMAARIAASALGDVVPAAAVDVVEEEVEQVVVEEEAVGDVVEVNRIRRKHYNGALLCD